MLTAKLGCKFISKVDLDINQLVILQFLRVFALLQAPKMWKSHKIKNKQPEFGFFLSVAILASGIQRPGGLFLPIDTYVHL